MTSLPRLLQVALLSAWAWVQQAGAAQPPQERPLQVMTEDGALGEEIVRAARQYLHGPVLYVAEPESTTGLLLEVKKDHADTWLLWLRQGSRRPVRHSLHLHGPASRFDLAEAVAIGLPGMMARLAEDATTPRHPAAPAGHRVPGPADPAAPAGEVATMGRSPMTVASATPAMMTTPMTSMMTTATATAPPPTTSTDPAEASPASGEAARDQPAGPPAPTVTTTTAATTAPHAPTPPPPVRSSAPAAPPAPPRPAPLALPAALPPGPSAPHDAFRPPWPAATLAGLGAVSLVAAIGTGAAAIVASHQVDAPVNMHFDHNLDQQGKALNTAAITLYAVGAAALTAGGAWIFYKAVRHSRKSPRPQLHLSPAGLGLGLSGSF